MQPEISIVIAVYNAQDYIERCLESACRQTADCALYEVVIVDDGSTDASAAVVDRYAAQYRHVRAIHKKNEGTYLCRYDGMREAGGRYLIFLDSDDWLERCAVEELLACAKKGNYDLVEYGGYAENGTDVQEFYKLPPGEHDRRELVRMLAEQRLSVELWHRMVSGRIVSEYLRYFEAHYDRNDFTGIRNEDEFFFPAFLRRANTIYSLHRPLYHYREVSQGSIMKEIDEDSAKRFYHARTLVRAGFISLEETKEDRETGAYFYYAQIQNLFYYIGCILRFDGQREARTLASCYERWRRYPFRGGTCGSVWRVRIWLRRIHLKLKYRAVRKHYLGERGAS